MKDKRIKMAIICRKDLKLDAGRLGAQIAHAATAVITKRLKHINDIHYVGDFSEEMRYWMFEHYTKVVLACENEHELFILQKQAEEAGLINEMILETEYKSKCNNCDHGYIPFRSNINDMFINCPTCNGTARVDKQVFTCMAIGPDTSEKIDLITGHLKLYRS